MGPGTLFGSLTCRREGREALLSRRVGELTGRAPVRRCRCSRCPRACDDGACLLLACPLELGADVQRDGLNTTQQLVGLHWQFQSLVLDVRLYLASQCLAPLSTVGRLREQFINLHAGEVSPTGELCSRRHQRRKSPLALAVCHRGPSPQSIGSPLCSVKALASFACTSMLLTNCP